MLCDILPHRAEGKRSGGWRDGRMFIGCASTIVLRIGAQVSYLKLSEGMVNFDQFQRGVFFTHCLSSFCRCGRGVALLL